MKPRHPSETRAPERFTRHAATRRAHRLGATIDHTDDGATVTAPPGHHWAIDESHQLTTLPEVGPHLPGARSMYRSVIWGDLRDRMAAGLIACPPFCFCRITSDSPKGPLS